MTDQDTVETPRQRFDRLSLTIDKLNGGTDPQLKAVLRDMLGPAPGPTSQPPQDADFMTPLWMQNELYPAQIDRALIASLYPTSGVIGMNDLAVAQHAAGPNLSVDVAPGVAAVWGSDQANQFPYICRLGAIKNIPLAAVPPAGQERRDLIVAHVHDDAVTGSTGLPPWRLEAVQGANAATGTSVPPAVPTSSLALSAVGPITNTTSQILTAQITDRRGPPVGTKGASQQSMRQVVSSGLTSTFTIPPNLIGQVSYLRCRGWSRSSGGANSASMNFNGDTGNNYSMSFWRGNAGTWSYLGANSTGAPLVFDSPAPVYHVFDLTIWAQAKSPGPNWIVRGGSSSFLGNAESTMGAGAWFNTVQALSSITFTLPSFPFTDAQFDWYWEW